MSLNSSQVSQTTTFAHRRYLSGQPKRYAEFLKAAEDYGNKYFNQKEPWLYRKPFDSTPGNATYFALMYDLMNLLRVMNLPSGSRILEVGSGAGWLTEVLLGLGYEVIALDPSSSLLQAAKKRVEMFACHHAIQESLPVEFRAEALEECGVPTESVDGVIFSESLHHIVDERAGLAHCFRVLRPGGVLGVTAEGAWSPGMSELEAAIEAEMTKEGTLENPFTIEYLDDLLKTTGFETIIRYHGVNGFFPIEMGNRTILDVAQVRGDGGSNRLTAWKPGSTRKPITAADRSRTSCSIHVKMATLGPKQRAMVHIELHNTGETTWLPGHPTARGFVTVALFAGELGQPTFREAIDRNRLPQDVAPGERITFDVNYTLPGAAQGGDWKIGLVCEGVFWFPEQELVSFEPAPGFCTK